MREPHPISGGDPVWSRIPSKFAVNAVVFLIVTFWVALAALIVWASVK